MNILLKFLAGLYAKLDNCEFCVSFLDFLDHKISADGILMDPKKKKKKISAILELLPTLNNFNPF
jgi:hypothetical protein